MCKALNTMCKLPSHNRFCWTSHKKGSAPFPNCFLRGAFWFLCLNIYVNGFLLKTCCLMASDGSHNPDLCGNNAETGAALRKRFKRAVIQGGSLKGARYSDISDSDVRKNAKGYRGDPRFLQFCKQFVASETVVSTDGNASTARGLQVPSRSSQPWAFLASLLAHFARTIYGHFRGRWVTLGMLVAFAVIVISRPAFGRLCGRILGLSVKLVIRRTLGLLTLIIDSVLEEAASQVDFALLPAQPRESLEPVFVPQQQPQPLSQLVLHLIGVALGALLGRHLPRDNPLVRQPDGEPRPWWEAGCHW